VTPENVLEIIGDLSALDDVRRFWAESMAAMPKDVPDFLRDAQWKESARWCGFAPEELDAALGRVAAAVRENEALRRLAWHAYWRVFLAPEPCPPSEWPEPVRQLGEADAGLFYLLVALAVVPLMREHHRKLGVPETVTRNTAQQVKRYCDDNYRRGHAGRPGVYRGQMGWLRHYTRERYFRLGRLEYWLGANPYTIEVYRHKASGNVVALAADGTRFNDDGAVYRDPAEYKDGEGWTATLTHDAHGVTGYLIDPNGFGTRRRVTLPAEEWTGVLKHGDSVLMLHIPSGGRMTPEACRDSLIEAAAFFPEHFPEETPRAVVCTSWIFSPVLQDIFPSKANLCVFQRNLYLFPVPSGPWDGLWFVFLQHGALDPETAPRDTALQRGIVDYLRQGRRWRQGGMFILMEDIPNFGTEFYRSNRPPVTGEA